MSFEDLDEALRSLAVFDVGPERARLTRERCEARLAQGRRRSPVVTAFSRWEPMAALGASALYLLAAVRAATLLLTLGPKP